MARRRDLQAAQLPCEILEIDITSARAISIMAILNESTLRGLAQSRTARAYDSMSGALDKSVRKSAGLSAFDIFLSHSYLDKELIVGALEYLERMHYTVYVDWRDDTQLSRKNITKQTAATLRERIAQSSALFFATTTNASDSKWMPWELGYMDGKTGRCAVLPISERDTSSNSYQGQEYLSIYPYITTGNDTHDKKRLWVHEDAQTYVTFEGWVKGKQPTKRD
jgi:hypothetical protein